MCDDKDDSLLTDGDEEFMVDDDVSLDEDSNVDLAKMDARRKLEWLREQKELRRQLDDDLYDSHLDDEGF